MVNTETKPGGAKEMVKQFMHSLSNGEVFKADVKATVVPRYMLDKEQAIKRVGELVAITAGGSASLITVVEEGTSACARILLTQHKHDLLKEKTLDRRQERIFEGTLWLEVNGQGQISQFHVLGDVLTPAMVMGMKMVPAPKAAKAAA
jgi:hypothetical protein